MKTYSSSKPDGVDAIQIEIASTLRNDGDKRAALIENLAYAIGSFTARYVNAQSIPTGRRPSVPRRIKAAPRGISKQMFYGNQTA